MKERNSRRRLIALAIAVAFLLNAPILQTVNKPTLLFGIPLLYLYVFVVWLVLIIIMYMYSSKHHS